MKAVNVYLALGSNVGDREGRIREALRFLDGSPAVRVVRVSSMYETEPYGVTDQPMFINAAAEISTTLAPVELLALCKEAESAAGLRPDQIDLVLTTGGTSLIPAIRDMLHERYGAERVQQRDTFTSVATGLAIVAQYV